MRSREVKEYESLVNGYVQILQSLFLSVLEKTILVHGVHGTIVPQRLLCVIDWIFTLSEKHIALSIYPSIYPFVHLSICPFIHLSFGIIFL